MGLSGSDYIELSVIVFIKNKKEVYREFCRYGCELLRKEKEKKEKIIEKYFIRKINFL